MDLFDKNMGQRTPTPEPPAQKKSPTSLQAAAEIASATPNLRTRVLHYIRSRGILGATDQEIQEALEMDPSTERPRRGELAKAQLIRQADWTRTTRAGRQATVWIAGDNTK